MPTPRLTPGAVRTTNLGEICFEGTRQLRRRHDDIAIMAEYGLEQVKDGACRPESAATLRRTSQTYARDHLSRCR